MKSKIKCIVFIISFLVVMSPSVFAKEFPSVQNVSKGKLWIITFNQSVDTDSLCNNVTLKCDSTGEYIHIDGYMNDDKTGLLISPGEPYVAGQTYTLSINTNVKSSNKNLKEPASINFTINKN